MGRKPRAEAAGDIFHVCARRVDRWSLFVDESDYRRYLRLLERVIDKHDWLLLSFCLMPNHVHLLVQLQKPALALGMHDLHGPYVRWFNDRHDRTGRLFEDRYHPHLVDSELYFLTVVKYIEQNPVNAALCERPEDWRWSSRGLIAAEGCPNWLADEALRARSKPKDGAWHRL